MTRLDRFIVILAAFIVFTGMAGAAWFQRPTPTVVGGATSTGTLVSFLVDSDGNLQVENVGGSGGTVAATQSGSWNVGMQATGSNGVAAVTMADTSSAIGIAAATTTEIVPAVASESIYVTGYGLTIGTTTATAQTVQWLYGTGALCATGQVVLAGALTGATQVVPSTGINLPTVITHGGGLGTIMQPLPVSQSLCIRTTGVQPVSGYVAYAQR